MVVAWNADLPVIDVTGQVIRAETTDPITIMSLPNQRAVRVTVEVELDTGETVTTTVGQTMLVRTRIP